MGVWLPLDVCHRSDQSCQVDTEDLQEAVAAACITEVLAEIKVENSVPPNRPAAMLYLISAECISLPLNQIYFILFYFLMKSTLFPSKDSWDADKAHLKLITDLLLYSWT